MVNNSQKVTFIVKTRAFVGSTILKGLETVEHKLENTVDRNHRI